MYRNNTNDNYPNFSGVLSTRPHAIAFIDGSPQYSSINGIVKFYQTTYGVVIVAEIKGLPNPKDSCDSPVFAFHIHEGESCTGNESDPFANARMHYNPYKCPHPYHAGDLPPLFGANGYAFSAFLTDRFRLDNVIGRTVIIHSSLDDFMTQPSGNAGIKIACGQILPTRK